MTIKLKGRSQKNLKILTIMTTLFMIRYILREDKLVLKIVKDSIIEAREEPGDKSRMLVGLGSNPGKY